MMNMLGMREKNYSLSLKKRVSNWTCVYLDIQNLSKDKHSWKVLQYKL